MEVITTVSCIACFFFSLGMLHGIKQKKSAKKDALPKEYPKPSRISSTELFGK